MNEHQKYVRWGKPYYDTNKVEISKKRKVFRETHPDVIKPRSKRYYATHQEEIHKKSQAYRRAHPEKERIRHAKYNAEHPEYQPTYQKTYYVLHKEKLNERHKANYAKNPKKHYMKHREWANKHPDKMRAYSNSFAKRRRLEALMVLSKGKAPRCETCGCPFIPILHINHLAREWAAGQRPRDEEGNALYKRIINKPDARKNLNILCGVCNWAYHYAGEYKAQWGIKWKGGEI